MTQPSLDQALHGQLIQLNKNLAKQLSFKRGLLMSIVGGVGYALGAGLIAGLVIAILSWSIHSVQDVPVLNRLITNTELDKTLHTIEDGN